jgi:hypothetical protein
MIALAKAAQITYLLVAGCTGPDVNAECPVSSYVESWSGPVSQQECNEYIASEDFNPTDYVPGFNDYIVRCEPKPTSM